MPTAFWFVPRLEHNQEFNLALAGKKENWVWVLFCFSFEQGKSPKPFTAPSPAVLSWATYLIALVRSENRGWQQDELTQDDYPKLPGAELWHPECQQQTAGAVPGRERIREGWDQFPDVLSCLPLAMPLDLWAPPESHAVKFPHQLINICVRSHRSHRPTGCKSAQPPWPHSPFCVHGVFRNEIQELYPFLFLAFPIFLFLRIEERERAGALV